MSKKKISKKVTKKTVKTDAVVAPQIVSPAVKPPVLTMAETAWEEIKDVKLDMFGLPGQLVNKYYKPLFVDSFKLHLVPLTRATSALQALETALAAKYAVELADKYVVVTLKA
jgi:hypothetical protein